MTEKNWCETTYRKRKKTQHDILFHLHLLDITNM